MPYPKCPKCGDLHLAKLPCRIGVNRPAVVLTAGVNRATVLESTVTPKPAMSRKGDRHRPGYMRDYMAKRRGK